MFAFVDETGHTGPNIFDPSQPYFMTGALMTRSDFDMVHGLRLKAAAARIGVEAFHAKLLKQSGIDGVAADLLGALKRADARLLIARVEKKYLLAAKVADTLLDPYENKAVPRHVYNMRVLRMALLFKLSAIMTEDLAKVFWDALMNKAEDKACGLFSQFCGDLLPRCTLIPDARSREILSHALAWARDNPTSFYLHPGTRFIRQGSSPNIIGFINLLDGLQAQSDAWQRPLVRLKHDRQIEFQESLQRWHKLLSSASDEPVFTAWGEPMRKVQTVAGSEFVVSSSADSPGLQAIDIVLWLAKRVLAGEGPSSASLRLLRFIGNRTTLREFTFSSIDKRMSERVAALDALPVGEAQLAAAMQMRERFEQERLQAIADHATRTEPEEKPPPLE